MPLTSDTRLGSYENLMPLGAGIGKVRKARDTRLDRIVAIKVLAIHRAWLHPKSSMGKQTI